MDHEVYSKHSEGAFKKISTSRAIGRNLTCGESKAVGTMVMHRNDPRECTGW